MRFIGVAIVALELCELIDLVDWTDMLTPVPLVEASKLGQMLASTWCISALGDSYFRPLRSRKTILDIWFKLHVKASNTP